MKITGKTRLGFVALLGAILASSGLADAQWSIYEETSIPGTMRGAIRKGHIFKTRSAHVYEVVDYVYLYEYELNPEVVVLSNGSTYKLVIDGVDEPLGCKCLNCRASRVASPPSTRAVVDSSIVSEFNGLDHGNIYKLANGQIWEQTEVWIWVWLWINPQVLIWEDGGVFRMKVEGIDHPVMVQRIGYGPDSKTPVPSGRTDGYRAPSSRPASVQNPETKNLSEDGPPGEIHIDGAENIDPARAKQILKGSSYSGNFSRRTPQQTTLQHPDAPAQPQPPKSFIVLKNGSRLEGVLQKYEKGLAYLLLSNQSQTKSTLTTLPRSQVDEQATAESQHRD